MDGDGLLVAAGAGRHHHFIDRVGRSHRRVGVRGPAMDGAQGDRAAIVADQLQAAAGDQLGQGVLARQPGAQRRAGPAGHRLIGEQDLHPGLFGEGVQRVRQGQARDVEAGQFGRSLRRRHRGRQNQGRRKGRGERDARHQAICKTGHCVPQAPEARPAPVRRNPDEKPLWPGENFVGRPHFGRMRLRSPRSCTGGAWSPAGMAGGGRLAAA